MTPFNSASPGLAGPSAPGCSSVSFLEEPIVAERKRRLFQKQVEPLAEAQASRTGNGEQHPNRRKDASRRG